MRTSAGEKAKNLVQSVDKLMHFEAGTVIARPIDVVFSYLTDVANFEHWMPRTSASQPANDEPILGTTFEIVQENRRFPVETIEYERNRCWTLRLDAGSGPAIMQFLLTPLPGGTRLTYTFEIDFDHFVAALPNPHVDGEKLQVAGQKRTETTILALKKTLEG